MNKIEYGTEFLDQLKDSVHDLYDENKELKKEIERLKIDYQQANEVLAEQSEEIERLNKENKLLKSNPNFVYAMRNHKAIEYIEKETENINNLIVVSEDFDIEKVLEILKGDNDV